MALFPQFRVVLTLSSFACASRERFTAPFFFRLVRRTFALIWSEGFSHRIIPDSIKLFLYCRRGKYPSTRSRCKASLKYPFNVECVYTVNGTSNIVDKMSVLYICTSNAKLLFVSIGFFGGNIKDGTYRRMILKILAGKVWYWNFPAMLAVRNSEVSLS